MDSSKITRSFIADLEWIAKQLKTMGEGFRRPLTQEFLNRSKEFCLGVIWERERLKESDERE